MSFGKPCSTISQSWQSDDDSDKNTRIEKRRKKKVSRYHERNGSEERVKDLAGERGHFAGQFDSSWTPSISDVKGLGSCGPASGEPLSMVYTVANNQKQKE